MKPTKRKGGQVKKRKRSSSSEFEQSGGQTRSVEETLWKFLIDNREAISKQLIIPANNQDLEENANRQDLEINRLQEENNELRKRLAIAEGRLTRAEKVLDDVKDKATDLTTRSMRDNLIFKNIAESKPESYIVIEKKLRSFLADELNVTDEDQDNIVFERAHRMGKPNPNHPRPIVVKLNSKGKNLIMRHLRYLHRECPVKITEQYPPEVHAGRNKLWPMFMEAKQQGKEPRWNIDELQIGSKTLKPPKDRNTDINQDGTDIAVQLEPKHTAIASQDGSHFQGHIIAITSKDEVLPGIKALCGDSRVAGATHIMYAYRVGNEAYSISNWEDDGEWGGARCIMDVIKKKNAYNKLICVTRWYGGKHLGKARFDLITQMAEASLDNSESW